MLSCMCVDEEETDVDDADEDNVALARYSLCLQKYRNTELQNNTYINTRIQLQSIPLLARSPVWPLP